jgi:hypothetical protein
MPSTDVSRAPRPSTQIVRPRDAASEALALGLLRYGPETVGIVLFGVASILLAALSVVVPRIAGLDRWGGRRRSHRGSDLASPPAGPRSRQLESVGASGAQVKDGPEQTEATVNTPVNRKARHFCFHAKARVTGVACRLSRSALDHRGGSDYGHPPSSPTVRRRSARLTDFSEVQRRLARVRAGA